MSVNKLINSILYLVVAVGVSSCVKHHEVRRLEPRGMFAMYGTYNDPASVALTCGLKTNSLWTGGECFVMYDEELNLEDPIDKLHSIFMESIEFNGLDSSKKLVLTENDIRSAACTGGFIASCTLAELRQENCLRVYSEIIVYHLSDKNNNGEIRPDDYDPRKLEHFRAATLKSFRSSAGYGENCAQ